MMKKSKSSTMVLSMAMLLSVVFHVALLFSPGGSFNPPRLFSHEADAQVAQPVTSKPLMVTLGSKTQAADEYVFTLQKNPSIREILPDGTSLKLEMVIGTVGKSSGMSSPPVSMEDNDRKKFKRAVIMNASTVGREGFIQVRQKVSCDVLVSWNGSSWLHANASVTCSNPELERQASNLVLYAIDRVAVPKSWHGVPVSINFPVVFEP